MKARIQVICGQPLPFSGCPTTGAGLRAWSLGEGLQKNGFDVVYSLPKDVLDNVPNPSEDLQQAAFDYHKLGDAVDKIKPDVVLTQGWLWANMLPDDLQVPLAIDLTGPYLLESVFSRVEDQSQMPFLKLQALRRADFITCAGLYQKHYFLPWLLLAGHDLKQDVCHAIPMSLSPDTPEPMPPKEPVFLYSGIFLPWQDASTVLRRLIAALDTFGKGRLVIVAGSHPTYTFPTGDMPALVEELRHHPRVDFTNVIPFDDLVEQTRTSTVFLDLMAHNVERELAFTTRTVVAMWSGLPVLYNNYSELSTYIHDYQAGWTLDPDDTAAIDDTFNFIFEHPDQVRGYGENAQRLIKECLNWEITIEPLLSFCSSPYKREQAGSHMDQMITPLDDRLWRSAIQLKNSSAYHALKGVKRCISG
jgi:glycosyltransferase involved in cell wall biosynthesis